MNCIVNINENIFNNTGNFAPIISPMDYHLLLQNLTNPAFLFFCLGIVAVWLKSDLEIPANSSKFISLYLLFAIGFKGGQELAHETLNAEIAWLMLFAIALSLFIPVLAFFIVKKFVGVSNAGAIAAAYGSVSAVTFVTAVNYLEFHGMPFNGHMVAVMAVMESPAIISGLILMKWFGKEEQNVKQPMSKVLHHALTNGSVLLILGSLIIGYFADVRQAEGIKPFTNDLFKGFLAIFLLDMGIHCGRKLDALVKYGVFPIVFAIVFPLLCGTGVAMISCFISPDMSNRFILAVLAASASYIAVPAAMKMAAPQSNPGLYVPMALAITFPFNITLGMPWYLYLSQC